VIDLALTFKLITRKVFNETLLYYNVLESSQDKLQEYVIKK